MRATGSQKSYRSDLVVPLNPDHPSCQPGACGCVFKFVAYNLDWPVDSCRVQGTCALNPPVGVQKFPVVFFES